MTREFIVVTLIGALASFLTLLGAVVAERVEVQRRVISHALQFAAGVLTALVAFSLMPPALYYGSTIVVIVGFFLGGASFVLIDYMAAKKLPFISIPKLPAFLRHCISAS